MEKGLETTNSTLGEVLHLHVGMYSSCFGFQNSEFSFYDINLRLSSLNKIYEKKTYRN